MSQNLSRTRVWRLRMALAEVGSPNCALVTAVFQLGNVTWLSALVRSTRKSRFNRSLIWKIRPREAFNSNWDGPVIESLPAFPHCPAAGGPYARGFSDKPGGAA